MCCVPGADFMTKSEELRGTPLLLQIWDTAGQERFHVGALGAGFYRGASAALIVYDVTSPASVKQVAMWRDELLERLDEESRQQFPIVVLANKANLVKEGSCGSPVDRAKSTVDLVKEGSSSPVDRAEVDLVKEGSSSPLDRAEVDLVKEGSSSPVDRAEVAAWCASLGMGHLETSAKDGVGVQPAMTCVAMLALEEKLKQQALQQARGRDAADPRTIRLSATSPPHRGQGCCA
ncbi:P-loop containing nucleoside triphosphate hydrolase protein [Tribonema minus]|uniref:P-loop containing nucleoside triphosphate hydrolase protein n=1 Tax=Tribonema minus TaxID=303371 RepID=A0A836CPL3_9STRA|nr:P-loop containing nucleoside triphosphate hydrolase protein [Tribonema minus]